MTTDERTTLLDRYATGADDVTDALAGATDEDLVRRPAPDEWSPREIVHHLADSETMAYIRLRRLIAEDDPLIQGYDEPTWALRLHYDRPIGPSLTVLAGVRASSLDLLRSLSADEWERTGHAQRIGHVHGRQVARDLRGAQPRARRPDPACSTRRGLTGANRTGALTVAGKCPGPGRRRSGKRRRRRERRWKGTGPAARAREARRPVDSRGVLPAVQPTAGDPRGCRR